jgi:hypothetical protein
VPASNQRRAGSFQHRSHQAAQASDEEFMDLRVEVGALGERASARCVGDIIRVSARGITLDDLAEPAAPVAAWDRKFFATSAGTAARPLTGRDGGST